MYILRTTSALAIDEAVYYLSEHLFLSITIDKFSTIADIYR